MRGDHRILEAADDDDVVHVVVLIATHAEHPLANVTCRLSAASLVDDEHLEVRL